MKFEDVYDSLDVSNKIAVYAGRFQPPHVNHFKSYSNMVEAFGKDNVYICMSEKVDVESPLTFEDRKLIWTDMFNVDPSKIVCATRPYVPTEFLTTLPESTQFIIGVGSKDVEKRFTSGKYFVPYSGTDLINHGYNSAGYVYTIPSQLEESEGETISGTYVRTVFRGTDLQKKKDLFVRMYGEYDKYVFDVLCNKITAP